MLIIRLIGSQILDFLSLYSFTVIYDLKLLKVMTLIGNPANILLTF